MADGVVAALKLQPSETAVLHVASRIFAGWIAAGKVSDENASKVCIASIKTAIQMASKVDELVYSDDEKW